MDFLQNIVDAFSSIPMSAWEAIGAALGISVLLQGLKNWLSLQSDKVITFLLGSLSFVAAAIDYLSQAAMSNPAVLGQDTAAIVGLSTILYRYIVKPTSNLISDAREYRARKERLAVEDTPIEKQNLVPLDDVQVQVPVADQAESVDPVSPADF